MNPMGRPKRRPEPGGPEKYTLGVYPSERERWGKAAHRMGIPLSEFIRRAADALAEEDES